VNDRLSQIEEFKYIDRNWGQLDLETPAVKFPCAISDIEQMSYTDLLAKAQIAECEFTVTIAVQNFHNSSQKSPCKAQSNDIYNLIDAVNLHLQGYGTESLSPFRRLSLQKIETEKGYAVYQLRYSTATTTQVVPRHPSSAKPAPRLLVALKK